MFKKTITLAVLVGLVLALAPTAQAEMIAPVGYDGPYRLAFVTTSTGDAFSADIDDYNTFVTTAANAVPDLVALNTTWKCIGSTLTVNAIDNTGTTLTDGGATDVPIYTTTGLRIAANNAALWGGSGIENPISYDDGTAIPLHDGTMGNVAPCYTGTRDTGLGDGSASPKDDNVLGSGNASGNYIIVTRGGGTTANNNDTGWIDGPSDGDHKSWLYHYMALSDVINPNPVPEPGTMSLLAIGGLGVLLMRRRRRA